MSHGKDKSGTATGPSRKARAGRIEAVRDLDAPLGMASDEEVHRHPRKATQQGKTMSSIIGTLIWTNRYAGENDFQHPAEVKGKRANDWIVEYLEPGKDGGDPQLVGRTLPNMSFTQPSHLRRYGGAVPKGYIPRVVSEWMQKKQQEGSPPSATG
jgi:hypothetical protein